MATASDDRAGRVVVIIPALDEEEAIAEVVRGVPRPLAQEIIVVDNGSTDATAARAAAAGARVVREARRGYGAACFAGVEAAGDADILVFLDGDRSDDPREMPAVLAPLLRGEADLVLGARVGGRREPGAMPWHARLGNALVARLIRTLYDVNVTDVGSFRAIRSAHLGLLTVQDRTYGWPVEMVVKAARHRLRIATVPITYRRRRGQSKVAGTFTGSVKAAYHLITTVLRYAP